MVTVDVVNNTKDYERNSTKENDFPNNFIFQNKIEKNTK